MAGLCFNITSRLTDSQCKINISLSLSLSLSLSIYIYIYIYIYISSPNTHKAIRPALTWMIIKTISLYLRNVSLVLLLFILRYYSTIHMHSHVTDIPFPRWVIHEVLNCDWSVGCVMRLVIVQFVVWCVLWLVSGLCDVSRVHLEDLSDSNNFKEQ